MFHFLVKLSKLGGRSIAVLSEEGRHFSIVRLMHWVKSFVFSLSASIHLLCYSFTGILVNLIQPNP